MALPDDLNQLAQQDVVYLSKVLFGNWVFNTSTGQNRVAGIDLGPLGQNWSSSNTPAGGLINISNEILSGTISLYEGINLMSVIPADLAD